MAREARLLALAVSIWFLSSLAGGSEIADANQLFVLEKYEESMGLYQKAASEEGGEERPEALFGLARSHQMLGQWKLAKDVFERLLREHPDQRLCSKASMQLGQCELRLGNLQKALAVFRDIEGKYAGQEEGVEARYNIANLNIGLFDGDVQKALSAIEGYRSVLDSGRGKRFLIPSNFGLAQCYMLLQDYDRALRSFRVVVDEGPGSVWANYARDQMDRVFGSLHGDEPAKRVKRQELFWNDFSSARPKPDSPEERLRWGWPGGVSALRVQSLEFSTEPRASGAGARKVLYVKPTMRYKHYVFQSNQGTVDRTRRSVQCTGNVKCTNDVVPPTVTVTSGDLVLDLTMDKAIFSLNVEFERRAGERTVQQLFVPELHLMLDSGKIEVPPQESGQAVSSAAKPSDSLDD